jgi:ankyrin repeat protein
MLQNGETALTWACTTGYAPSVEALLKAGANLSVAREVRSPCLSVLFVLQYVYMCSL